jgi:hypothetical protein
MMQRSAVDGLVDWLGRRSVSCNKGLFNETQVACHGAGHCPLRADGAKLNPLQKPSKVGTCWNTIRNKRLLRIKIALTLPLTNSFH